MIISDAQKAPPALSTSRAKIWIRTGILALFSTLFGLALYKSMTTGVFHWSWACATFLPCFVIGFWMRKWVPMQAHLAFQRVTLSFDRVYFALILLLVVAKAVAGQMPAMVVWANIIMCVILGLMMGRLSGICLRVRDLKIQYGFITR